MAQIRVMECPNCGADYEGIPCKSHCPYCGHKAECGEYCVIEVPAKDKEKGK